jgi:hypothetical protein
MDDGAILPGSRPQPDVEQVHDGGYGRFPAIRMAAHDLRGESMPRVSYAFFTFAACCALIGMAVGMHMGASQDFALRPAHAHINVVGWLSMAVMGGFYALDRGASKRLAWINFGLSGLGGVVLPGGIALIVTGHAAVGGLMAMIGGLLTLLGMASFLIAVLGGWRRAV